MVLRDWITLLVNTFHQGNGGMPTLSAVVVTVYGIPWLVLILLPLIPLYYWLQRCYRMTSRELKRLSSITLSPLYTHFNETLQGLKIIRAFCSVSRKSSRKSFVRSDRVKQRKRQRNRYKVPEKESRASTSAKKLRIADTCFDVDSSIAYRILNFFVVFSAISDCIKCRKFKLENEEYLESNQKAQLASQAAGQWLSLRIQMIGVVVVSGIGLISVIQHQFSVANPVN
ncbi:hypothetical protein J437_LFUL016542 [Ladona fulva]|uniref:ABC transmembrane type-1 domain-containing protein n=1 Tax=Ladona fulva TaxID=123851 RepID=A0A8K0KKJ6_LADFU|nr:hypothetical protein J437_LFUL016542 [Ladona fulva]